MKHFFTLINSGLALFLLLWLDGPTARAQAPALQLGTAIAPGPAGSLQMGPTTTDAAGNVYVAGFFFSTVNFGSITLTAQGYQDLFIAKWSPVTRDFVWVQRASGRTYVVPSRLVASGGSVFVSGQFYYTATFGTIGLTNAANPTAGTADVFVAKLVDAGPSASWAWAVRAGGPAEDQALGLAVSGPNVYTTGYVTDVATVGSTSLGSPGTTTGFVAKLVDAGSTAQTGWAVPIAATGPASATGQALAAGGSGVYVAGFFGGAAAFGGTTLTSAGYSDGFVAKLVDTGPAAAWAWALQTSGPDGNGASQLALSGSSLYVAGTFSGRAAFGANQLTSATVPPNQPYADMFVAKISDSGPAASWAWATRGGGARDHAPTALVASGSMVYMAGYFGGVGDFGSTTLTSYGGADGFVAKLNDGGTAGTFVWAQQAGGTGLDICYSVAVAGTAVYASGLVITPATFNGQPFSPALSAGTRLGYLATLTDPTLTATTAARGSLSFSLSPNPAHATATVQLPAIPGATSAVLTLTDALGRPVRTETVALATSSRAHSLDLRGLAPGLYAVQVSAGNTRGTQRLVVE